MTTTRIYLVRHGATQLTAEDRFSGSSGVELSEEGRWQAARLGERLAREGVHAVYSSALSRPMSTARIIAGECGGERVHIEALREIRHGRREGVTRRDGEAQVGDECAVR